MDRTDRFNSLNKLSIEKRLLKVFRKTKILLSMTGVIACVAMGIVSYQYSYALKHYGFAQGDIGKAMIVIAEMRSETRAAIGYDDDTLIATAKNAHDLTAEQLDTYISALEDDMITDEGRATYQQIKDGVASYQQIEAQILELGTASDSAKRMQAQQMAGEQMDPVFQQVYADMTSLLDSSVTNGNAMEAKLNVFRVVIFIVILLIIGVGFAGSEKTGKRIARGIAGPLKALADRLDGFAAGDLSSEFPEVKTEDEVAEMNRAAIAMAENLRMIIEDIKQALNAMANGDWTVKFLYPDLYAGDLDELKEALRDIKYKMNEALYNVNSVSGQVSMGAGSLADAAQSLAEGATEQAGAVQQLQATITNITSMVDNTAEHTKNSSRQAQEYSAKADEGRTEMNHLMEIMEQIAREHLPDNIGLEWSGLSYQEKQAGGQTGMVMALVFLFVFLFLAAQYESWTVPIAVLLSLPVAALGAYLGVWVCGLENDVYFQIGLVMLVGLAAKNAILIVEFAKVQVDKGEDLVQSAIYAARLRFRPILMTSLAFVLGMLPMVLASGPGSASRQAIGTGVFFGMIFAIVFGIILVPFFFVMVYKTKSKLLKQKK